MRGQNATEGIGSRDGNFKSSINIKTIAYVSVLMVFLTINAPLILIVRGVILLCGQNTQPAISRGFSRGPRLF
jgi:hypothetical protein